MKSMKNIINIKRIVLIVILVTFSTISCSDYLDVVPGDSPVLQDAFLDRNESEKYLMTCYSFIPSYGNPYQSLPLLGNDEIFYTTEDIQFTFFNSTFPNPYRYGYGATNTSSSPIMNFWEGNNGAPNLWDAIRHCNVFLEHMPLESGGPVNIEESERNQWMAEVKVLKAFFHYYLFTLYGPIPIVDEAVSTNAGVNEFKIYREPIDDVVNYIVETIDEALPDLKNHTDIVLNSEAGRITKTVALAIKAKTLVWSASPLFNGNTDFKLTDNRGIELFPQSYDQNKWQLAKDAIEEVLESANENGFSLHYSDGSEIRGDTPSQRTLDRLSVREAVVTHWNDEIIWANYENGSNLLQSWAGAYYPGVQPQGKSVGQRQASPLHIIEQFYSANGVPISVDNEWINNDWYNNRFTPVQVGTANSTEAVEGQITAQINLNRSPRFYASVGFDRGYWEGNGYSEADFRHLESRAGEVSGAIGVRSISMTGYYCKKVSGINNSFLNPGQGTGFQPEPYAFPIFRLADFKLHYAECLNELGQDYTEILPILDEIRDRSGIIPVKEAWDNHTNSTDYDNQTGLREIIRQERLNELAYEGARFWDTRRWQTALVNMNTPVRTWNVWGETVTDYYNVVTRQRPSYSFKNYLMPISETSLINNSNLVQNPGW